MSRRRSPENCRSSNRLPATVATRLGSDGPILSIGQESVTRACCRIGSATPLGACRVGKRRMCYLCVLNVQRFDAGRRSCLQLWGLTGNWDESSARLLPGHCLGCDTGVEGSLDKVIGLDAGRIAHGLPFHVRLYAGLGKDASIAVSAVIATSTPIRM